jgi:hypothetical protein
MSEVPQGLREYLSAPALQPVWAALRVRLERRGHQLIGSVPIPLDDERADRLGGLLGRNLTPGKTLNLSLRDLDAALRRSAAQRGLAAVVAELTGGPLRDRVAEKASTLAERDQLWAGLDAALIEAGIASADWIVPWTDWLRRAVSSPGWHPPLQQTASGSRCGSSPTSSTSQARSAASPNSPPSSPARHTGSTTAHQPPHLCCAAWHTRST